MAIRALTMQLALFFALLLGAIVPQASAQAWIELKGPAQTTYEAPATYQFQINSGVVGTGPKAEFLSDIRLKRNNSAVDFRPVATYTENGISAGVYDYVLTATAVKYINGDEYTRFLTSQVIRITVNAPPVPFDGAEYVSLNYPRNMDRGLPYTGSVTFRNVGTTTWRAGDGYRLGQAEGYSTSHFGFGDLVVPHDVAPGGTAQFSFSATAPMAVGDYTLSWQMNRNGARFGASSGQHTIVVAGKFNHATSYEQNVPTTMVAGRSYAVKFRFRNGGNTTWYAPSGYYLGSWNPANNTTWGVTRVPVKDQVPGGIGAVFEFNVVAPSIAGTYNLQWRMVEEGFEWFGEPTANVQVVVTGPPSEVVGNIDEVTADGMIRGWACSKGIDAPIDVHVYLGGAAGVGTFGLSGTADQASEPGVGAACAASGNHRFSLQMSNALRQQHAGKTIYVHGISPVGQPNKTIGGSGNFTVPPAPSGSLSSDVTSCTLASGAQNCIARLTWTANDVRAQLVRSSDGGVLASGLSGAVDVAISVGINGFKLVVGGESLAQTSITGNAAPTAPEVPADARRYVYDEYQRLCKTIEPEVGATVVDYDAAGNVAWLASGLDLPSATSCSRSEAAASGRRVNRAYDVRNRVVSVRFPDHNGDQDLLYRDSGQLRQVTTWNVQGDETTVNTYQYNKLNLLTGESVAATGRPTWSMGYGYDPQGALASVLYPSGLSVTYNNTAQGRPLSVSAGGTTYASSVRYHPSGAIKSFNYGNGIAHVTQLNARQLPYEQIDQGAAAYRYSYDANGNVTGIADLQQGVVYDRAMQYDGNHRLLAAGSASFSGDHWHRYTYDTRDNLLSASLGGVKDHRYWYDARNRLTNILTPEGATVTGLTYDEQGNLRNKNGRVHEFDFGNRLRAIQGLEAYQYDAAGRRTVASDLNGERVRSFYGQGGDLFFEQRRGVGSTEYVRLGSRTLALRKNGTVSYQHLDSLGSLVAATNAAGVIVERTQYEPYGAPIGEAVDGMGYTGHVSDAVTGLIYMQQRYYDPQIGRFLSADPVTVAADPVGMFNRYKYAANNPYGYRDPDGRQECRSCEMSYGASVGYMLRNDKERMQTWSSGEAAAMTAGSGAEDGALIGQAVGSFVDTGKISSEGVKTLATVVVVGAITRGKSGGGGMMHGPSPRISIGKQGKHQIGHNNYTEGRSVLAADPVELGRHAGTGQQVGNVAVGLPGSKERVNYGREIGTFIDSDGNSFPTSNGIIHYAKDGVHIVPSRPSP